MDRDAAASFIGGRYLAYLTAVGREAEDSAGNLAEAIDDALRALGYSAEAIPAAEPTEPEAEEDLRVQLAYRTMGQVVRDLGATSFDVTLGNDSFKLSQLRAGAEKELAIAEAAVLERFGTTGVVAGDDASSFMSLDLNYLDDACEVA